MTDERAKALSLIQANEQTRERLSAYVRLLGRWRGVTNLISEDGFSHIWDRHIADCAQLLGYAPTARRWVDLGSGAGLPGMILAILLADTPGAEVHCIESDQRKCAFLREAARETAAPAIVHAARIESVDPAALPPVDAVTSRALAPLPRLVEFAYGWLTDGAVGVFPCGRSAEKQIGQLAAPSRFVIESFRSKLEPSARIVCVRAQAQTVSPEVRPKLMSGKLL